jgi:two-component system chemotaxis response regulator CheB
MSTPIRVLVVDDAVIVRRLIGQALSQVPGFDVVGTASDGDIALRRIEELHPDAITLDIDMPEMNGLETLREIRKRWPGLSVVMFTGVTEPGARELEALGLGANDCVTKVPHEGNMVNAIQWTQNRLAPRLKAVVAEGRSALVPRPVATRIARPPVSTRPFMPEVLAIGASTGGPNALEELLRRLPADFPLPILVVQHMPVGFTRLLAERLAGRTQLAAAEAEPGAVLRAGKIWIAPGDQHMTVERSGTVVSLQTNREAPENSCRPAADVLFRSLSRAFGAQVLGVVLTGMGQDGLLGAQAIVQAGGQVMAQDEASSVVWGMPGAVVRAGLASQVLPLAGLAEQIVLRTHGGRSAAARM